MEFGNCQDRVRQVSWSRIDSNYLDVKSKVFKKDGDNDFPLVQNLTIGEAGCNLFMRMSNQIAIAAENFARKENFSPVLIPTMSKNMNEQLKVAHKVVDVVDRSNGKIFVTLLRYSVDKPETKSFYAQVQFFQGRKRTRSFSKLSMWNINFNNWFPSDVMNSGYDNIIRNKRISNVL